MLRRTVEGFSLLNWWSELEDETSANLQRAASWLDTWSVALLARSLLVNNEKCTPEKVSLQLCMAYVQSAKQCVSTQRSRVCRAGESVEIKLFRSVTFRVSLAMVD